MPTESLRAGTLRLAVLGSTGGVGRLVVRQAVERGHHVVAVLRERAAEPAEWAGADVRAVRADVLDPQALSAALKGTDAVLSAIGSRGGRAPTTVCADAAGALIPAMAAAGVARLVVVSTSGLPAPGDDPIMRWLAKPVLRRVLKHPWADMARMEELVRSSPLDWTIVRPTRLIDGPRTGRARVATGSNPPNGWTVSRSDVAAQLLACLDDEITVRSILSIAR
jgi:putative NADH-flavin reductase